MTTKVRLAAVPGINLRDYSSTGQTRGWGTGWPACDGVKSFKLAAVTAARSKTKVTVNARVARLVNLLMDRTEALDYRLIPGQCGGNNCRQISGTNRPSNHSWGLAFDMNWNQNTYNTTGAHDIPEAVYALWSRYGFANGGDYIGAKQDWMHFEFMGTPAQADQATDLALRELGAPASIVPKPRRLDDMSNGMLPADRDGEFFFVAHAGDGASSLVSRLWVTLSSRSGISGRWRWLGADKKPIGDYVTFNVAGYDALWADSGKENGGPGGVFGIEGYYTSNSPVGWEIEKQPR